MNLLELTCMANGHTWAYSWSTADTLDRIPDQEMPANCLVCGIAGTLEEQRMTCDQCGQKMIFVGRQVVPENPERWVDAWVCQKFNCPGYGTRDFQGSESRWPAMTLMATVPLHANIRGALKFRDASKV